MWGRAKWKEKVTKGVRRAGLTRGRERQEIKITGEYQCGVDVTNSQNQKVYAIVSIHASEHLRFSHNADPFLFPLSA